MRPCDSHRWSTGSARWEFCRPYSSARRWSSSAPRFPASVSAGREGRSVVGVVEGEGGGGKGGGETTAGAGSRPSSITGRYVTIAMWSEGGRRSVIQSCLCAGCEILQSGEIAYWMVWERIQISGLPRGITSSSPSSPPP